MPTASSSRLAGSVVVLAVAFAACGKKDDKKSDAATASTLTVPAAGTLSVDSKVAGSGSGIGTLAAALTTSSANNHTAAAVILALTDVYVGAHLAIPVALLGRAAQETAKPQADGTYLWSYDITAAGVKSTANLTGTRTGDAAATWVMDLTTDPRDDNGCCDKFELLAGATTDAEKGTWTVDDPTRPKTKTPLFTVDYDYKSATDKTLNFTIATTRSASERFGKGSYVHYTVDGDTLTLRIRDASETAERTITIDATSGAGNQVDPAGTKACWGAGSAYADIAC